jgi:glycosyltransferase involved in cell wall biosynthesis
MRVLQLIDSLHTGGAERVAVNMANALDSTIDKSCLCTTREEGLLKESMHKTVGYLFLNKQKTIDLKAIRTLNRFIKNENINIIHAHSSSFFLATIIKLLNKSITIVWHDHYGNSEFLEARASKMLKKCSRYFSYVFSVNRTLETWAKANLNCKHVDYLPNFATENINTPETNLKGEAGKRIVHLANLREQKDHITLINAFKEITNVHPEWTLHCVGKDFKDDYSQAVKEKIKQLKLENNVFIYGSRPDVSHILKQSTIGVLSSKSEGLPIALLEYGLAKLPVVTTRVGECANVIDNNNNGLLVNAEDEMALSKALLLYIEDQTMRERFALAYTQHIENNYSEKAQINTIIEKYKLAIETL